jgi:hypothetical protein
VERDVKHLIEFLLCGTIGAYCVMRCAALLPRVIAEAHAVVRQSVERRREIDAIEEASQ